MFLQSDKFKYLAICVVFSVTLFTYNYTVCSFVGCEYTGSDSFAPIIDFPGNFLFQLPNKIIFLPQVILSLLFTAAIVWVCQGRVSISRYFRRIINRHPLEFIDRYSISVGVTLIAIFSVELAFFLEYLPVSFLEISAIYSEQETLNLRHASIVYTVFAAILSLWIIPVLTRLLLAIFGLFKVLFWLGVIILIGELLENGLQDQKLVLIIGSPLSLWSAIYVIRWYLRFDSGYPIGDTKETLRRYRKRLNKMNQEDLALEGDRIDDVRFGCYASIDEQIKKINHAKAINDEFEQRMKVNQRHINDYDQRPETGCEAHPYKTLRCMKKNLKFVEKKVAVFEEINGSRQRDLYNR